MTQYMEATHSEVEDARQIVFLADVQQALQVQQKIRGLSLRMTVTEKGMNTDRRVEAIDEQARPATRDGGVYVHPIHGSPEGVAYMIACEYRAARKTA